MIARMVLLAQVVGLALCGGRLGADDRNESDRLIDEVLPTGLSAVVLPD